MTALGARTPSDLTRCDVLIRGSLREFGQERGIDTRGFAVRSRSPILPEATGGLR
jgi:isopentenyl-diphosphate Delta-isomerase